MLASFRVAHASSVVYFRSNRLDSFFFFFFFFQVEDNCFSVSIHYRNCARADVPRVREIVERVQSRHERIRMGSGKEVGGK